MGVVTSQKITVYYDRFKTIDVTFTKEIIQVTSLITNQVFLKCGSDFWPCVIYSSSFQGAKIVANIKSGILHKLEQANQMASLRFSFKNPDTGSPVTFFINTKSLGYSAYGGSADVALFNLQFTQRPPDDLIEIMGRILDANVNSAKRREERITITPDSARRLNIFSKESAVFIQGVPRRCILRDISFSGAKLIMMGVAKFLVEKDAALRMDFDDPRESFLIKGKFLRAEVVEGRKDLVALVVLFDETIVPMGYKIRVNDFLSQVRADTRGLDDGSAQQEKKTPAKASAKSEAAKAPLPDAAPEKADEKPEAAAPAEKPAAPADKPAADTPGDFDLDLPSS
ncbi:PilZN3 domain-containing protein [Leadbettera azotonutricia]|uniref:PilZN3 domain-containing protein n=1 Tax=Leadbettera azotonutricia (strain ATCC BAA-888 / DSM 13862 / ZAS-9) TaxID=545695 RepID=F5Y791_LEAAZ|nr:PilZN3 domain-containing protein [Leadbettera azotonutricia]AEF82815.1 conserved hypothetical protein [Leadbettera azotonutricia ZAS-9]